MLVTDAQVHVWAPETPERPWPPPATRPRPQGPPFSAEELLERMSGAGVDRAILVPPSFEGDRNDFCLAAAQAHPGRFRVMGRIDLTDSSGTEAVARWRETPGMLGVRLTFGFGESMTWLRDGRCEWFWAAAEAANVPVMLYPPGFLPEVADVARRYPGLRLVVDHLGVHPRIRDEKADPELAELVRLAEFGNVAVKATCVPSLTSESYPFPSLHDRLRRVVEAFGPRRVFWGSDLTRLPCDYREVVTLFTKELTFLDGEDLELVMGKAISEWLGWD
jgi:L-fuconolactonase